MLALVQDSDPILLKQGVLSLQTHVFKRGSLFPTPLNQATARRRVYAAESPLIASLRLPSMLTGRSPTSVTR